MRARQSCCGCARGAFRGEENEDSASEMATPERIRSESVDECSVEQKGTVSERDGRRDEATATGLRRETWRSRAHTREASGGLASISQAPNKAARARAISIGKKRVEARAHAKDGNVGGRHRGGAVAQVPSGAKRSQEGRQIHHPYL